MSKYSGTFDWVQFPEGRARFSGTFRCWDEQGRKTFALELRGKEYFGEIDNAFLENQNDYNIVIDAFGYSSGQDVGYGMPSTGDTGISDGEVREVFTPEEEAIARVLVVQLVRAGLEFDDPPTVLDQTETSHFMGKVVFREGWMLVGSYGAGTAS